MGKNHSKSERHEASEDEAEPVESPRKDEDRDVAILKSELDNNFDLFVLNNLLMSVAFFENYDSQIKDASFMGNDDREFSPLNEHQISFMKPNSVLEQVDRNVKFRRQHGPKKFVTESIVPRKLFVIYENIEILSPEDSDIYSSIDKSIYKATAENAAVKKKNGKKEDLPGFIELKYIPEACMQPSSSVSSASTSDSDSATKSDDLNESEYNTIINARTPKPLNDGKKKSFSKSFIIATQVKNIVEVTDDDNAPMFKEIVKYEHNLNSTVLMNHFKNKEFQYSLGEALGYKDYKKIVDEATYNNTNVFYNVFEEDQEEDDDDEEKITDSVQWELIPAVEIHWPDDQTFEWYRCPTRANRSRDGREYQWPRRHAIEKLRNFKTFAIPRGCLFKRGTNERLKFEWELAFPIQEKYLESKLGHIQLKAYFLLNALFKSYIEPRTQHKGLLVDHLRNLIILECEKDCLKWPQHRLGRKMLELIQTLFEHLGRQEMPDYFVRKKNLFRNIPAPFLRKAQEVLNEIKEFPLMHFLQAIRNLHYVSTSSFYPKPDVKELYNILTDSNKTVVNIEVSHNADNEAKWTPSQGNAKTQLWDRYYKEKRHNKQKAKKEAEETRRIDQNLKSIPRTSTDSMELKWTEDKTENEFNRSFKILNVLEFFIEHFIDMGKYAFKIRDHNQSLLYLKQAYRLARVLGLDDNHATQAEDYEKMIEDLKLKVTVSQEKMGSSAEKPSLPLRNANSVYIPNTFIVNKIPLQSDKLHEVHKSYEKKPTKKRDRPVSAGAVAGAAPKTITFKENDEIV